MKLLQKNNEILPPTMLFHFNVLNIKHKQIEDRYAVGYSSATCKQSKIKYIVEYIRVIEVFNTEEQAKSYKDHLEERTKDLKSENDISLFKEQIKKKVLDRLYNWEYA